MLVEFLRKMLSPQWGWRLTVGWLQ